jgi:hypothetical protein
MQAQHGQHPVILTAAQLEGEPCPQVIPRQHVLPEQLVERASTVQPPSRRDTHLADGPVPGCGDSHRLLGRHRLPRRDGDRELASDPPRLLGYGVASGQVRAIPEHPRPRRLGDADVGLVGLHDQHHGVGPEAAGPDRGQVTAGEPPVARYAAVRDRAVEF